MSAQSKSFERSEKRDNGDEHGERASLLADLAQTTAKIAGNGKKAEPSARLAQAKAQTREIEGLVEKLNAASRDIIEAVDGTLPRDLEKAYAGNEHGVYAKRLSEGRGRRLERLIAERYGSERLVRGRVDSYIRMFERLLDRINATPGGDAMVDQFLASEQGRIYVMLAEAAGRIPKK